MLRVKCAIKALGMSKWFLITSWGYVTTKRLRSKVEFFIGFIPAWVKFTAITYKDYIQAYK